MVEERIDIYHIPTQVSIQLPFPKLLQKSTYHITTQPPPPPKHLPPLNPPNPNREDSIQRKIRAHGRKNPRRRRRLPAQIPIRVEGEGRDGDGGVADEEADGGFGVILGEGVGVWEGG